jgi:hypothetical protein
MPAKMSLPFHKSTYTLYVLVDELNNPIGRGEVIYAWDIGLQGMKQGGVRLLIVPPQVGYGNKDIGAGPNAMKLNSWLVSIVCRSPLASNKKKSRKRQEAFCISCFPDAGRFVYGVRSIVFV